MEKDIEKTVDVTPKATKKPAVKKTVSAEKAVAEKPAAKKPAAKKPAVKKAVVKEEVKEEVKVEAKEEVKAEVKAAKTKLPVKANPKKVDSKYVQLYKEEICQILMKKFNYKSVMQIPHIEKIVLNMGVGDATSNSKLIDAAFDDLRNISGQQPIITKAKKSIATFKVREGNPIGVKVTLRGDRMYEFYSKLVNVCLPRVRDFRGVSSYSFDGRGNYTLGIKEQLIFPEINYDKVVKIRGMDIVIVTTAKNDEEGRELLKAFHMPFEK